MMCLCVLRLICCCSVLFCFRQVCLVLWILFLLDQLSFVLTLFICGPFECFFFIPDILACVIRFLVVFIYSFLQSWVYSIWWLWIRLNHSTADLHWDDRNVPTHVEWEQFYQFVQPFETLFNYQSVLATVVCHQIGLTSLPFQSSPSLLGSVPVHYSIISIKTICFIKIYGLCFLSLGPVSLSSLSWFSFGLSYSISWGTSPQVALLAPLLFCSWSLH